MVSPELAALLMAVSSITVTLNALRLKGFVPAIKKSPPGWGVEVETQPSPIAQRAG
jgi:Cu+-exporting ATPase